MSQGFAPRPPFRGGRGGGYCPGGSSYNRPPHVDVPMPVESIKHDPLLCRPGNRGTAGASIDLRANFYKFDYVDHLIYQYHVLIVSEKHSTKELPAPIESTTTSAVVPASVSSAGKGKPNDRFLRRFAPQILAQFIADHTATLFSGCSPIYDGGHSLYSIKSLPFAEKANFTATVTVNLESDGVREEVPSLHRVTLSKVNEIKLEEAFDYYDGSRADISEEVLHLFELVFRVVMEDVYEGYQRKYFDLATLTHSPKISNFIRFASGFIPAVRMTEFGLALNLHLKTSCLISPLPPVEGRVVDFLSAIAGIRPGSKPSRGQIVEGSKMIRHLRAFTTHTGRKVTYTMESLDPRPPGSIRFKDSHTGTLRTIAEYFTTQFAIRLLDLPMVKTTGKVVRYLPLELLTFLPNQFLSNAKINAAIQRELLLKSTYPPNVYFSRLEAIAKRVAGTKADLQSEYGLELSTEPVAFAGRVLPQPKTLASDPRAPFYKAATKVVPWAVFCFDDTVRREDLARFIGQLKGRAGELGIGALAQDPRALAILKITTSADIYRALYNLCKKTDASLVFIGLPRAHPTVAPSSMYKLVKSYTDQTFGRTCQCFAAEHVASPPGGYFETLLLKVNGKLGGSNSAVDPTVVEHLPVARGRTMMVGIDVNHPGVTEKMANSVAAAVGSMDAAYTQYKAAIRVQARDREEIVRDLAEMMSELLTAYQLINGHFPEHLVVFRDGVSEGQFVSVQTTELHLIKAACQKVVQRKVKILLLVVQKRHHTRFVRETAATMVGGRKATYNVPNGTVVDHTIVEPAHRMFYLNSHFSPLGTSKPTKYLVLCDELALTADQVQALVYTLCHSCVRTRAIISLPIPVRYADLCAYRAKMHIEAKLELEEAQIESKMAHLEVEEGGDNQAAVKRHNEWVEIHETVKSQLYYC